MPDEAEGQDRIPSDLSVQMAFACENFSTDPLQRITFHNVVEQFNAPTFPTTTAFLYCVFAFQRTVPGFLVQCKLELLPPSGQPMISQLLQDMAFRPDQMTQKAIIGYQGIMWPGPGEYTFRFSSRGITVASFLLRLVQVQQPGQPAR